MTAIHRIDPEISVETPKGSGLAYFLIDYGPSINTIWLVRLDATGDVLHVDSSEVRIRGNAMWNHPPVEPFHTRIVLPPRPPAERNGHGSVAVGAP